MQVVSGDGHRREGMDSSHLDTGRELARGKNNGRYFDSRVHSLHLAMHNSFIEF